MYRFTAWYKRQKSKGKRVSSVIILALAVLTILFVVGACIGSIVGAFEYFTHGIEKNMLYWAFLSSKGLPFTIFSYLALIALLSFSFYTTYKNKVKITDERGVHYMEDNTYGSSRWMQESEINRSFVVENIHNTTTTVYGQLTNDGKQVVGFKPKGHGGSGNRNVIVIASMGSGKSYGYVRTELIQAALRGDSFVVTDPSAELYSDLAKFFMDFGLNVRVLNLAEPQHSEFWNCLEETVNPETERLDPTRLNDFVNIFMLNSLESGGKKDFWYNSALNLLKAVIGYTAYAYEKQIIDNYVKLYKRITGLSESGSDVNVKTMEETFVSFPWCRKIIWEKALEKGFDNGTLSNLFTDITKYSSEKPYTIGQVFDNLMNFGETEKFMENVPDYHPAHVAYLTYKTNDSAEVRKSALQGTQLRFTLFTDNSLKEILSHDGIKLSEINLTQSAYFVITSDKSVATKPISSLFFSFLFKDAQDIFDKEAQISKEKGVDNPCRPVVAMLDEFFSIGVIGGSPESFGTTMSNSRKRKIYISIIVQVYSQIEALYGEQIRDVIQGGCSTLLYLGGNDPGTCEFISEFASGEATVLSEVHRQHAGLLNAKIPTDLTMRSDKRYLLTIDEARRWKDQVLVVKQGEYPLKLNPFPWVQHPLYTLGHIKPTSIYSNVIKLSDRLEVLEKDKILDPKTYINTLITNAFSKDSDIYMEQDNEDEKLKTVQFIDLPVIDDMQFELPEDFDLFGEESETEEENKKRKNTARKGGVYKPQHKSESNDSVLND